MKHNLRRTLMLAALGVSGAFWTLDTLRGGGAPRAASARSATPLPPVPLAPATQPADLRDVLLSLDAPLAAPPAPQPDLPDPFTHRGLRDVLTPPAPPPLADAASAPGATGHAGAAPAAPPAIAARRLRGIIEGPQPLALVDELVLPVGSLLDGYELVSLTRDRATFRSADGAQHEMTLENR